MVIYVLDSSAVLRFLLNQAGALRVQEILQAGFLNLAEVKMSAVQWGEVIGRMDGEHGRIAAEALSNTLWYYGVQIVAADQLRAQSSALLKRDWKLGYADAFCVELSLSDSKSILVTADYDFKKTEHLINTEFLPPNPPVGTIGPVQ